MSDKTTITLTVNDVRVLLPPQYQEVLVFHADGVDRGCLYGEVWRHAEYGEEQLHGVTHWSDLPSLEREYP